MKEPHVNVSNTSFQNYVNPVNYESTDMGTSLIQDPIDTEFVEGKVNNYYVEPTIIGNSNSEGRGTNLKIQKKRMQIFIG